MAAAEPAAPAAPAAQPNPTRENRNLLGHTIQVALYNGQLFRVDHEDAPLYVIEGSTAPFKFFTTTEAEALAGYQDRGHILRTYQTNGPLALVDMFHADTRTAVRALMTAVEQQNLNYSFPVTPAGVSRRSEADQTARNYSVAGAICRLFTEHGIHGYYIPRSPAFHSEVMLCGTSLRPAILQFQNMRRVSMGAIGNIYKQQSKSRITGLTASAPASSSSTNGPRQFVVGKLGFANGPVATATIHYNSYNSNNSNNSNFSIPPPPAKRRRLLPFLTPHNTVRSNGRKNRRAKRRTRRH